MMLAIAAVFEPDGVGVKSLFLAISTSGSCGTLPRETSHHGCDAARAGSASTAFECCTSCGPSR